MKLQSENWKRGLWIGDKGATLSYSVAGRSVSSIF